MSSPLSSSPPKLASIRSKTIMLVLACALPTVIGFATLSWDTYMRQKAHLVDNAQNMARALLLAVERDLSNGETAARALAGSPSLRVGDLDAFRREAARLVTGDSPVAAFVLREAGGHVLLRSHPSPARVVSVDVPVAADGERHYVLSAQLRTERFNELLHEQQLPPGWTAQVFDSSGVFVARNRHPELAIGRQASGVLLDAMTRADSGVVRMTSRENVPVLAAFRRSAQRGWFVSVGVPHDAARGALDATLHSVLLAIGALLAIGLATSWIIGGAVSRSVRALCAPAVALGRGEPLVFDALAIRETAEVADALRQVEGELQRYRGDLERLVRERTEELERSNALLGTVYATAPVGLVLLDCDLRIAMINDYLAGFNNMPSADHLGRTLPELFGEAGLRYEEPFRAVRDSGTPLLGRDVTITDPLDPASERHLIASYHPVFGSDQRMVGISIVIVDISPRIAAEQALRATSERLERSERFIRTIADNVPGMVGYWDEQLRCRFANRLYLESFGLGEEELIGRPIDQVLTAGQLRENAPHLREVGAGRAAHFAQEVRGADGQMRHTWTSYIPELGADGQVRGFYVLVSDISELKRSELRLQTLNEQLVGALERAEGASRAKTEFLANMSHEIRTPMNAIMGLARLLQEAPLGRREREYVSRMAMSTRSLLGILNDVLDFSKIEAGQLELEYTAFTLEQVLRSVAVLVEPASHAKGVELVFDVAPQVPAELHGDPMRLEQVLLNLIGNAVKFTEQGEVVLTVRVREHAQDEVALDFTVRDTGIGIAPEQQGRMFEAFSQGDSSTSRKFGGTGLGLAICRRLVALMGGAIAVRSEPGHGAQFTFDARFGAPDEQAAPPPPGRGSLLLVDDNASARAALVRQCAALGWEVEALASPGDALERLGARRYDLLLVDSALPGMDGISLLTAARAGAGAGDTLPPCAMLVAHSARERLDDLAGELQLGAVLSKPVTPGALAAALTRLVTGEAEPEEAAPAGTLAGSLDGLHVLLVEDNQINQEVAHYILLHAGAAVDIAANGRIAVDMLVEHPARYDVVLMDVQMPVMNGYQATEEIRRMGLTALPVIAMTANAMDDDRVHAINAGMDGHISKPIDVDTVVAAILRVTSGGTLGALPPSRRGTAQPAVARPPHAAIAPIAGIDLAPTLQRFGGDYDRLAGLLKRMESTQGGTVAEVRALLASGQAQDALPLLHRLRGVAANLGATEVAARALELEQDLKAGRTDMLEERLDLLDGALEVVLAAARGLAPPPGTDGAAPAAHADIRGALAHLRGLLQNNNLTAIAAFEALRPALRPALGSQHDEQEDAALAEAVATLAFANAAVLVEALIARMDTASSRLESKGSA